MEVAADRGMVDCLGRSYRFCRWSMVVNWWELPSETPLDEWYRAFTAGMVQRATEAVELRRLIERRFREAEYPHPYTIDPITGVRR